MDMDYADYMELVASIKYHDLAFVGLEEEEVPEMSEDYKVKECISDLCLSSGTQLMYKGKIVDEDDTPLSLNMNKDDQVLVFSQLPDYSLISSSHNTRPPLDLVILAEDETIDGGFYENLATIKLIRIKVETCDIKVDNFNEVFNDLLLQTSDVFGE